jgi:lipopolysaccharide/colanic/teichoic acid biosynthesis glycosyltransferase
MISSRKETFLLMLGDALCFYVALFAALFLRYQDIPGGELLSIHLVPFTILFAIWLLVFFIAGLYERQTSLFKKRLPSRILNSQIANSVIAVLFFYFLPIFSITPKTNLFLVLVLSFLFILYWRKQSERLFAAREREAAILIAGGKEMRSLEAEVNGNSRYGLRFASAIDLDAMKPEEIEGAVRKLLSAGGFTAIVADFTDDRLGAILPEFYNLLFSNVRLIEMQEMYEDIFSRVPLSLLGHSWFLENVSAAPRRVYDALKRITDIVLGLILLVISMPFDIAAFIAIKLDDGGPAFIVQERVGKNDKPVRIYKFRTMSRNDAGAYEGESAKGNVVTRVGAFLRKSRIDEFPQLWCVVRGDLSLIGPRPELPALADAYHTSVEYYRVRHLLKPGLSGWAQIYHENHPHHGLGIEETREKLSYDLFYVKHRSFLLDLKIALRTVQTLVSRSGR